MQSSEFETSIADFLALGRKLQALSPLTGEQVLAEVRQWYRDVRIEKADPDQGCDSLLFQWGVSEYLIHHPEPVDHRDLTTATVRFLPDAHRYLDFTRQVVPTTRPPYDPNNENYDYEDDFDDVAVQMRITLIFEQADPNERGANMWIHEPVELEEGIEKFLQTPFVQEYLRKPAQIVSIAVGRCG